MITVESNMEYEESKGHKGELRSLASLRSLLGGEPEKPTAAEKPPTPEAAPTEAAPTKKAKKAKAKEASGKKGQAASETDQAQANDG